MPLKYAKSVRQPVEPEAPVQPEEEVGFVRKYGPSVVRGVGGFIGATPITGAIGGGVSETLAQMVENASINPMKLNPRRIGGEIAVGATMGKYAKTLGNLMKLGKSGVAALRGGTYGAAAPIIRHGFEEGDIDPRNYPGEVLAGGALGAATGGTLARLFGPTKGSGSMSIDPRMAPPDVPPPTTPPPVPTRVPMEQYSEAWRGRGTSIDPKYRGRKGLQEALAGAKAARAEGAPVTAETIAQQEALAADIARNPGGTIYKQVLGRVDHGRDAASLLDVEKAAIEAEELLAKESDAYKKQLQLRFKQAVENKNKRYAELEKAHAQEARNLNARDKAQTKIYEQDAKNLNKRDQKIAQDQAQDAKNLNVREKVIRQENEQLAKNLNKRQNFLEKDAAQQARNLEAKEKYAEQEAAQLAARKKAETAIEEGLEPGPKTITETSTETLPDGSKRTLKQTFASKADDADNVPDDPNAPDGPDDIGPSGKSRDVVRSTVYSTEGEALRAAVGLGAGKIRKLGRGKYRIIFNDDPPPPPTEPTGGAPAPTGPKPKGPDNPPLSPEDTERAQGRRYTNYKEALAIAKATGGKVVNYGHRRYRVVPNDEPMTIAEPPTAKPVAGREGTGTPAPKPNDSRLTPDEHRRLRELMPMPNVRRTPEEMAEYKALQSKLLGETSAYGRLTDAQRKAVDAKVVKAVEEGYKGDIEALGEELAKNALVKPDLTGSSPIRFFKSGLEAAGENYGAIKAAKAAGENVPEEGRSLAGRLAQQLNRAAKGAAAPIAPKPAEDPDWIAKALAEVEELAKGKKSQGPKSEDPISVEKFAEELSKEGDKPLTELPFNLKPKTDAPKGPKPKQGGLFEEPAPTPPPGKPKPGQGSLFKFFPGNGPKGTTLSSMGGGQLERMMEIAREDPAFTAKLLGGVGGAALGAGINEDDRLAGALTGGLMGAVAGAGAHRIPEALRNNETIKEFTDPLVARASNFMRASLLSHPMSMVHNSIAGPWGSTVFGGLEQGLKGVANRDPEQVETGINALKGANPLKWGRGWVNSIDEATHKIDDVDDLGRFGQFHNPDDPTLVDQVSKIPATWMLTGDLNARNTLSEAGISDDLLRKITLTAEPERALWKNIANWGKARSGQMDTGEPSTIASLMMPFKRTAANIMESGTERTPILGSIINYFGDESLKIPFREQLVQQGLGGMVFGLGYAAGNATTENANKTFKIHSLISNLGGQYSLLANAGFVAGQAVRAGKSSPEAAVKSIIQGMPLPTADPVTKTVTPVLNVLKGEPTKPADFVPDVFKPRVYRFIRDELDEKPGSLQRWFGGNNNKKGVKRPKIKKTEQAVKVKPRKQG